MGGGYDRVNIIDRFQFVATANSSDVGDLADNMTGGGGTSSTTHAYYNGGYWDNGDRHNNIYKVQMVATANATDVADLTVAKDFMSTSQI